VWERALEFAPTLDEEAADAKRVLEDVEKIVISVAELEAASREVPPIAQHTSGENAEIAALPCDGELASGASDLAIPEVVANAIARMRGVVSFLEELETKTAQAGIDAAEAGIALAHAEAERKKAQSDAADGKACLQDATEKFKKSEDQVVLLRKELEAKTAQADIDAAEASRALAHVEAEQQNAESIAAGAKASLQGATEKLKKSEDQVELLRKELEAKTAQADSDAAEASTALTHAEAERKKAESVAADAKACLQDTTEKLKMSEVQVELLR
jgi:hypothetical protein